MKIFNTSPLIHRFRLHSGNWVLLIHKTMAIQNKLINLFYNVATGDKKHRIIITPIAATGVFILVAFVVIAAIQIDKLFKLPKLFPEFIYYPLGIFVIAVGILLMLWAVFHFLKVKGTPVPFNPPPKLVTNGPYAYSRNPMLSGVFILMFGLGILNRSITLFFIFTPLFIFINYLEVKNIEEPELEKRLGKDYIEYKKRTPMFFPRVFYKKMNLGE